MPDSMPDSNDEQREFWTAGAGPDWVAWADALDTAFRPVLEALLSAAALRPGERVVDVGCGTGACTRAAAEAVGAQGHATGLDISPTMIEAAQRRAGGDNLSFVVADAQTDPLPRADALVSRFGMMFFADPVAAFRNMAAHLEPGARLTFACWAGMPGNPWFRIPFEAAVERLGPLSRMNPTAPGPTAFKDAVRVTGLMRKAGLADVTAQELELSLAPAGDVADVARLLLHLGPAGRALREKNGTVEDARAIEAGIAARLAPLAGTGGMRLPAQLLLYRARTPAD